MVAPEASFMINFVVSSKLINQVNSFFTSLAFLDSPCKSCHSLSDLSFDNLAFLFVVDVKGKNKDETFFVCFQTKSLSPFLFLFLLIQSSRICDYSSQILNLKFK